MILLLQLTLVHKQEGHPITLNINQIKDSLEILVKLTIKVIVKRSNLLQNQNKVYLRLKDMEKDLLMNYQFQIKENMSYCLTLLSYILNLQAEEYLMLILENKLY